MKNKDDVVTLVGDNGEKIVCDVLFTCYLDEFDRDYVVFITRDTEEVSAGYYVQNKNGTIDILNIESDEEWDALEEMLEEYKKEMKKKFC